MGKTIQEAKDFARKAHFVRLTIKAAGCINEIHILREHVGSQDHLQALVNLKLVTKEETLIGVYYTDNGRW
jgi:hypothetical protein